jgi:hypothetical protein
MKNENNVTFDLAALIINESFIFEESLSNFCNGLIYGTDTADWWKLSLWRFWPFLGQFFFQIIFTTLDHSRYISNKILEWYSLVIQGLHSHLQLGKISLAFWIISYSEWEKEKAPSLREFSHWPLLKFSPIAIRNSVINTWTWGNIT